MHDYKDKVFEMLAIEPEQPFYLEDGIYEICAKANNKYKLTNDLTLYVHDKLDDEWAKSMFNISNILTGEFRIKHIKEPTEDDKVVIAYAKLCGCNWLSKDEDGEVYGSQNKPVKKLKFWKIDDNDISHNLCDVSFLSWKDEEPYYIGD